MVEKKGYNDPFNNFEEEKHSIDMGHTPGNSVHYSGYNDGSNLSISLLKKKGLISLSCMTDKKERKVYCLTTKGAVKLEEFEESMECCFDEKNPGKFTLGANEKCDIVIKGEGMSRQHLSLLAKGSRLFAQDLNSSNGSFRIIRKDETIQADQIYRIGLKFLLKVNDIGVVPEKVPTGNLKLTLIDGRDTSKYAAWIRLELIRKVKEPINSFYYEEIEEYAFGLEIETDPNILGKFISIANEMGDISDISLESTRARIFWSKEQQKFMIQDMSQKDGGNVWFSLAKFGEKIKNDLYELLDKDTINIAGTVIKVSIQ